MKLLLYCTKAKPELYSTDKGFVLTDFKLGEYFNNKVLLNGKIVIECDFEVEEIYNVFSSKRYCTETTDYKTLEIKSCLNREELFDYLGFNFKEVEHQVGYAIHIKNLHIFDEPKELSDYYSRARKMNTFDGYEWVCESIDKAPQNMMYAQDEKEKQYILISIRPEWLCKILNGEKTIEVRKKVLKEMLK